MAAEVVYEPLFDAITPLSWVLTPNRRLARVLLNAYNCRQQQAGRSCWRAPTIMAWADCVDVLWQKAFDSLQATDFPELCYRILTDDQALAIWQRELAAGADEWDMLKPESLAAPAFSGWQNLQLWSIDHKRLEETCVETLLFKRCAQRFELQLTAMKALCAAQIPSLLCQYLQVGVFSLPAAVWLTGFDDVNPAQQALLQALAKRGCAVDTFEPTRPVTAELLPCADQEAELALAAAWAKQQLIDNPKGRIGWVIPDLPSRKLAVERVLTQVFAPQDWRLDEDRHAPGYNISVAEPLGFTPPIAAALHLIGLMQGQPDFEAWQALATSIFLGAEVEAPWRARLLAQIRRRYHQVTWRRLLAATDVFKGLQLAPIWQQNLTETLTWRRSVPRGRAPIGTWIEHWQALLTIWKWPGERSLDTLEYQQLMQWPVLLADLKQLDFILGPVTYSEALAHLGRLSYRPFAAQTGDSPLQVLGLLEAAGQPFDALWIMGMDGRHWPPPAEPNPLLPIAVQRTHQMPRSSSSRELILAERLTHRLFQAAPQVVVSFCLRDGDRPLVPSPLVEHLPLYNGSALVPPQSLAYSLWDASSPLECFRDDKGPALSAEQEGGAQVLKDQAGCPFAAFARHRLNASNPQPLLFGINPGLRGSLLHTVLFRLWQAWQTQAVLAELAPEAISKAIGEALQQSWLDLDPYMGVAPALREIEDRRCQQVVQLLLEQDRQRPPFNIAQLEAKKQIQLGGLRLNLRLDRVDTVADGSQLVIDYKSRESTSQLWLDERPTDPQVPLYCLLTPNVVGALFGLLEPGKEGYVGLLEEGRSMLNVPHPADLNKPEIADWQALLGLWQQRLQALADEFSQGVALTTPNPKMCRVCDLKTLCRYRERSYASVSNEETEELKKPSKEGF